MAKRASTGIRQWALIGAEQRLTQLAEETAAILNAFPELRQQRRAEIASRGARVPVNPSRRRRRRKMSADARKRISDAQKARWAKQKAKK